MELIKGDCLQVMKGMPSKSIDLIVTDPPYEVSVTNGGDDKQRKKVE